MPFLVIGIIFFFGFLIVKPGDRFSILLPLLCLIGGTFVIAFAKGPGVVAQIATLLQTMGLSFIFARTFRDLVPSSHGLLGFKERFPLKALLVFLLIILAHNFGSVEFILCQERSLVSSLNPWGLFVMGFVILFALGSSTRLIKRNIYERALRRIVLTSSFALATLELLVVSEVIPGNTAKVLEGVGGIGLANLSTNETAVLACSLLLLTLSFLWKNPGISFISLLASVANILVIALTKSRIGLALAALLLLIYFIQSKARRGFKVAVLLPFLVGFLVVARDIAVERTLAEAPSSQLKATPLTALPGSGRPILWFYYLDTFVYTASSRLLSWLFGFGAIGMADLYNLTPLSNIGLVLEEVQFYPLHSDLITIFLTTGLVGLFCWVWMLLSLARIPKRDESRFRVYAGLTMFAVFTTVDMLNYFPVAALLIMYAIVSGFDLRRSEGPSKI